MQGLGVDPRTANEQIKNVTKGHVHYQTCSCEEFGGDVQKAACWKDAIVKDT